MATKIEYLDETWNPITGCSPISEGCTHCWAKIMAHRFPAIHGYYQEFDGDYHGWEPAEFKHVRFHPERLDQPLKWKKPRRIGVCFMGDLFHKNVKPDWIYDILATMYKAQQHIYLILTKRPELLLKDHEPRIEDAWGGWPHCAWLGVTVENENNLWRIEELLKITAAKYFGSFEPLLGPIDLSPWLGGFICDGCGKEMVPRSTTHEIFYNSVDRFPELCGHVIERPCLDWAIVGGETGPGARPMNPDWARSIADQCRAAGVPFFFKKMGGNRPTPPDLMIREFPEC